jgi:hypothetical protein
MSSRITLTVVAVAILSACDSSNTSELVAGPQVTAAARPGGPTATWAFPIADEGLSVRSDGRFLDATGAYSLYAHGVCTVSSPMFITGSGDNTIAFNYPKTKVCGRTWTVSYPDGVTETLAYQGGVQVLQNETFNIPVGTTALRHMRFGTGNNGNPAAARCGQGLVFGPGGANPATGSDSVAVTRIDASTWEVASQAAPNDHAYCVDNGQLYEMQVRFRIISSQPLP